MFDKPMLLEEICEEEDFSTKIEGNIYCTLAMDRPIYCLYQADKRDHNDLYPCNHPLHNFDETKAHKN